MIRNLIIAAVVFVGSATPLMGQQWARDMFEVRSHDFGTVVRGASTEFSFVLQNKYVEDIHIASVRSSCGCTTPRITKGTLATWEEGAIVARFNTHSFTGYRNATLTVVIDRPFYAEVQLTVRGHIRTDIVIEPGKVNFGQVSEGSTGEVTIRVEHIGRSNWQIVDVRSANSHLEVELSNRFSRGNRIGYDLVVRLKDDAPAGYLNDQLILVTNDARSSQIAVAVEGRVQPALTVSPASLFMGVLEPGEQVTKQLVVRANRPFRITSIECLDGCFEFSPDDESKELHIVPVTFTAGDDAAQIAEKIEIETDYGDGVVVVSLATATVRLP